MFLKLQGKLRSSMRQFSCRELLIKCSIKIFSLVSLQIVLTLAVILSLLQINNLEMLRLIK